MGKQDKVGKSHKALLRSGRHKGRNASDRPAKVMRARKHHLRNALRSCGEVFAEQLRKYYTENPTPGKKVG
jgi:hypothetical protein